MAGPGYGYTWVATPPHGESQRVPSRRRGSYRGPPAYPAPPRWGFPRLAWRSPTLVPGADVWRAQPRGRLRTGAYTAVTILSVTAAAALVATGAEIWRYVLLLRSRNHLLSASVVAASDVLTDVAGVLAIVFACLAAVATLVWLHRARTMAAVTSGEPPVRGDWQALAGPFVPGLNLVMPFSVLAELEHAALERDRSARPRPTRLLLTWWSVWVTGALLFVATLIVDALPGVQAQADGVVLHAVLDASAVAVAVCTALVVQRLTACLGASPAESGTFRYVLRVSGAPEPTERAARPAGATR